MFDRIQTALVGCFELQPRAHQDERGVFVKTFQRENFIEFGLESNFVEQYYSVSRKNVLRGLHFQTPPHDHAKLVYCPSGKVFDVVVDIRRGSPTYGDYACFELSADRHNIIYMDKGFAHGFFTLSETAVLIYNVGSSYAPEFDKGIRWNSLSIPWPDESPIASTRDSEFPSFDSFESPFSQK